MLFAFVLEAFLILYWLTASVVIPALPDSGITTPV